MRNISNDWKLYAIILIAILGYASCLCNRGFYADTQGSCQQCHRSCRSCMTGDTCVSCEDSMKLNNSTGLCEMCPDKQYFDTTSGVCRDCSNNCIKGCSYQLECFECASEEYYDLESMQCVSQCQAQQRALTGSKVHNLNFCRSMDFYVAPSSTEILELGTKDFPYKNIMLPFIEILSFHSHSNSTVNVYVAERAYIPIMLDYCYLINIKQVNMLIYSDSSSDPDKAILEFTDSSLDLYSVKTRFNIMANVNVDLVQQASLTPITTYERNLMYTGNVGFMITRTGFKIEGFELTTDYASSNKSPTMFKSVFAQDKLIQLSDLIIEGSGSVFWTQDPLNFAATDLDIDYYKMSKGFVFSTLCASANSSTLGEVSFSNITVYNSQERSVSMTDSFIYYSGVYNLTVTQSEIAVYGSAAQSYPPIQIQTTSTCNLNDSVLQSILIEDTKFNLNQNEDSSRFTQVGISIASTSIRKAEVSLVGCDFGNLELNYKPVVYYKGSLNSSLIAEDIDIKNSTFQDSAITLIKVHEATLKSLTLSNITQFGEALIVIEGDTETSQSNIGFTTIDDLIVSSISVSNNTVLQLTTVSNFTLSSSNFSSIELDTGTNLISVDTAKGLKISGCKFVNILEEDSDEMESMIAIGTIDLNSSLSFVIEGIAYSKSNVPFWSISAISSTATQGSIITASNLQFVDSEFSSDIDLVSLAGSNTNLNFTLSLTDISFTNISFAVSGNLMHFSYQYSGSIEVDGLTITDTVNSHIALSAANSLNTNYPTRVSLTNVTTSNVDTGISTLFVMKQNTHLEVYDSAFADVYGFEEGSVLSSSVENTEAVFYNSTFTNNAAITGGVFKISNYALLKVYDCKFTYNFAVTSAIVVVNNNAAFEFYNCDITNNIAVTTIIAELFDNSLSSLLNNCRISNNSNLSKFIVLLYIQNSNSCGSICWFPSAFKSYLLSNQDTLDVTSNDYTIQSISSSLDITNGTDIKSQSRFMNAFISTINMDNVKIHDLSVSSRGVFIEFTASTVILKNIDLKNVRSGFGFRSTSALFQAATDTKLEMKNITADSLGVTLLYVQSSKATIDSISIENSSGQAIFRLISAYDITATNIESGVKRSIGASNVFQVSDSSIDLFENITMSNSSNTIWSITDSTIHEMSNIYVSETYRAIRLVDSVINLLTNCEFSGNGNIGSDIWGWGWSPSYSNIESIDSNITISEGMFTMNSAKTGAALLFSCSKTITCVCTLTNLSFVENEAKSYGGAIYYDLYRPVINNVTFSKNKAPYGPNIASYPVKLFLKGTTSTSASLTNVTSSETYAGKVVFNIVDYDNQTLVTGFSGSVKVTAIDENAYVSGTSTEGLVNGSASFADITFTSEPGSENVMYKVTSDLIDEEVLQKQFGVSSFDTTLAVSFRWCMPGESINGNVCSECVAGSYSFEWNSTECHSCMDHADCLGGTNIHVDKGYWRRSKNSTKMIECIFEEACDGGYEPENEHPVKCADGYSGMLCTECIVNEGEKYERLSSYECSKCPDLLLNTIRILGMMTAVALFFILLIIVNVRKKKESQQSILLRILANYFQLLTAALSFNLKFPKAITDAFYPLERLGNSSEVFLSFDCFVTDTDIKAFTPSNALFKIMLTGLLPIALILLACGVWGCVGLCSAKMRKDLVRNIVVTTICIIFLLHPMITKVGLEIFQCVQVDEGKFNVKIDITMSCFSADHIKWAMLLAFPMLCVWTIGCPLLMFIILYRNRHRLQQPEVQKYYLIIYQGLKDKAFYWELVNTLRKIIMVGINVFMSTLPIIYSAITAVLALVVLIRIQIMINPYKKDLNNKVEIGAVITGTSTLFAGVLFSSDDNDLVIVVLLILLAIIVMNVRYVLFWLFCMTFTLVEKHEVFRAIFNMLAFITCRRREAEHMILESGIEFKDQFSTITNQNKKNTEVEKSAKRPYVPKTKSRKRRKNTKLRAFASISKKRGRSLNKKSRATEHPTVSPIYEADHEESNINDNSSQFKNVIPIKIDPVRVHHISQDSNIELWAIKSKKKIEDRKKANRIDQDL